MTERGRPTIGDRVTLACSCQAEVLVRLVLFLPRHGVVRIISRGQNCRRHDHVRGRRVLVRWREDGSTTLMFADASAP